MMKAVASLFGGAPPLRARNVRPTDIDTTLPNNMVINSRYTKLTFIPKNIYEQFRRPLNFYFLLVAILQFIPAIAPVNPLSTLLPLLVAFSLTAIKEGLDDVKRHRQDDAYNNRPYTVLRKGAWLNITSASIQVGDVLLLRDDEEIPCDCVALAADAAQNGTVYVRTDNLDGESDFKKRTTVFASLTTGHPDIASRLVSFSPEEGKTPAASWMSLFATSEFEIECPKPNDHINKFDSRMRIALSRAHTASSATSEATDFVPNSTTSSSAVSPPNTSLSGVISLTIDHLLLQSCVLKNSGSVVCVACYTGHETRCGMNKHPAQPKWARVDQLATNFSKGIFLCQIMCAVAFGVWGFFNAKNLNHHAWYLALDKQNNGDSGDADAVGSADVSAVSIVIYPLRFFLLTTVMIPISFKMLVDVSKYFMAQILEWDNTMRSKNDPRGCSVKNSNSVEDLGQVQVVVSDKTGTLTQNCMTLREFAVSTGERRAYNESSFLHGHTSPPLRDQEREVLLCLALCNACEVHDHAAAAASTVPLDSAGSNTSSRDHRNINEKMSKAASSGVTSSIETAHGSGPFVPQYASPSPDEVALCEASAHMGVTLLSRLKSKIVVNVAGDIRTYSIRLENAFSSERKCMSVLTTEENCPPGRPAHRLWLKGADDKMLAASSDRSTATRLSHTVDNFAKLGLRTLCVAARNLSTEEVNRFLERQKTALTGELMDRDRLLTELQDDMEQRDITLLGATAVEDKLQDDVGETINHLLRANVQVWMLTGDKPTTALQIAVACKMFPASATLGPTPLDSVGPQGGTTTFGEATTLAGSGISVSVVGGGDRGLSESTTASSSGGGGIVVRSSAADQFNGAAGAQLGPNKPVAEEPSGARPTSINDNGDSSSSPNLHQRSLSQTPPSAPPGTTQIIRRTIARETNDSGDVLIVLEGGGRWRDVLKHCRRPPMRRETKLTIQKSQIYALMHKAHATDDFFSSETTPLRSSFTKATTAPGCGESNALTTPLKRIPSYSLLVEGSALTEIWQDPADKLKFMILALSCDAVVCARVSPSQKAQVTRAVKEFDFVTLAIGDGGNDVAMIQEAHVGVGILGKEGSQASRAADFAISQFRYLATLMLVHGQMSYWRTAYIIQYSFYKSMLIAFIQLPYNIWGGAMSGVSYWGSYFLTMWNGAFTLPQAAFYSLDRFMPRSCLTRWPEFYRDSQRGEAFNGKTFVYFIVRGIVQSVIIGLLTAYEVGTFVDPHHGYTYTEDDVGTVAYTTMMLLQVATVLLESHSLTLMNLIAILGMPLAYFATTAVYSKMKGLEYYGVFPHTLTLPCFALSVILVALVFIPEFGFRALQRICWSTQRQRARAWSIEADAANRRSAKKARGLSGAGGNGYAAGVSSSSSGSTCCDEHCIWSCGGLLAPADSGYDDKSSDDGVSPNDRV